MSKLKNLTNFSITVLALGTAYGLGILSCVYWEIKLIAECSNSKKEKSAQEEKGS